jgi:hypothetical protein
MTHIWLVIASARCEGGRENEAHDIFNDDFLKVVIRPVDLYSITG